MSPVHSPMIFHSRESRLTPDRITVTPWVASTRNSSATRRAPARVIEVTRRRSKITNCGRGFCRELTRHVIDTGKRQRADQLDDADLLTMRGENLPFMRAPAAPRRILSDVIVGDDAVAGVVAAVEHMEVVMPRQRLADLDAAHAVAVAVELWRVAAKPEPRRQCRQDTAADAALGGNADAVDPFAGEVVHAGTGHDRKRPRNR